MVVLSTNGAPKKGAKRAMASPLRVKNFKFCYIYTEFNTQITENPPLFFWNFTIWFFRTWKYNFFKISPSLRLGFYPWLISGSAYVKYHSELRLFCAIRTSITLYNILILNRPYSSIQPQLKFLSPTKVKKYPFLSFHSLHEPGEKFYFSIFGNAILVLPFWWAIFLSPEKKRRMNHF